MCRSGSLEGIFDKEALLSYTVICLWLRQMKILQISSYTGSFVYMLGRMVLDVFRWLIIYAFGAMAFSAGLYVLYRNDRAAINRDGGTRALGEECDRLDGALDSVGETVLMLAEITLDGAGYWACFRQSSAEVGRLHSDESPYPPRPRRASSTQTPPPN